MRLLGGSKCRYTGQGLKMAQGRAKGQPFLVQTRRTVTIILANPSVFGLIIGASQHARTEPPHRSRQASPRRPRCPRAAARPLAKKPARENRLLTASGSWPLAPWFLDASGC